VRIFAAYVLLLAVGLACAVVFGRHEMLLHVDRRIDAELTERVGDFQSLAAAGIDPATGKHLTSVSALLSAGIAHSTHEQNATVIALLDGRPYARLTGSVPFRIDTDPQLVRRWAAVIRSTLGSAATPAGALRFAAVPVSVAGDSRRGVFVAAVFASRERAVVGDVTGVLTRTAAIVMAIALVVGWVVAGRVLAPVRQVTVLARSITDTDIRRRIPVHGNDEVSRLASTFNAMLDRLELSFALQRSFLDDASHELRTPITIVRGHLELMEDDPSERKETLALVMDELDRMNRMVDDLLTLAKSGQPEYLQLGVVDVDHLMSDVQAKATALAPREWKLLASPHTTVVADAQRITQALMQLAANAVQHTEPMATISLGADVDWQQGTVVFRVGDSGPGIPLAEQQSIFERFHRGTTIRPESTGAGLGLAIVRSIAEAHHGHVEVHSVPGHGAEFRLVLPLDAEHPGGLV
jgi:signal transduction histidine kinase